MSVSEEWFGMMDIIETEYVTVNTVWVESEMEWHTRVLVSADVLYEFQNWTAIQRTLDRGRVGTAEGSKRLHMYALEEVYRGAYRVAVQDILVRLKPVDVQEDVSEL
jgi:hypothetical protein